MANGFDILKSMFNIKSSKVNKQDTLIIVDPVKDSTGHIIGTQSIKTNTFFDDLYNDFLNSTMVTSTRIADRFTRYKECKYAVYNEPIISTGVRLITDEVVNSDVQEKALKINASSKLSSYLYEFFEEVKIDNSFITSMSDNLIIYGDGFSVNDIIDNDILDVYPVDVFNIEDRIEFNPIQMRSELNQNYYNASNTNIKRLQLLSQMMDKNSLTSRLFKKVLFGYQIDQELMLPPWNVNHMRLFSIDSEFYPFGRPLVLNVLSTFYEYRNAMELMQLAKASMFPIEIFNVKVSESMTPDKYWEAINEAKQQYNNQSFYDTGKEEKALSKQIWLPEDHISFDLKNVDIDFDGIADLQLLQAKMASGMLIPPDVIMAGENKDGQWGVSGKAIQKQYKPLAREVYRIQSAILKELTQLARMKLALTGDFDYLEDFRLELSFPNIEDSSENIDFKSDLFNFSKDIIDGLAELTGLNSDEIPVEITKDILQKYSFIDKKDIDDWFNKIERNKAKEEEVKKTNKNIKGRLNKLTDSDYRNLVDSIKSNYGNLKEGFKNGNHYFSSLNISKDELLILEILNSTSNGRQKKLY